jgi:chaperone BCS1
MDAITEAIRSQIFGGLVAASVVTWLFYQLRELPKAALAFLRWKYTCTLIVYSDDPAFDCVCEWLACLDYSKTCRKLVFTIGQNDGREVVSPGNGTHWLKHGSMWLMVDRDIDDKRSPKYMGGGSKCEFVRFAMFGKTPDRLRALVETIAADRQKVRGDKLEVYAYRGWWRLSGRRRKRNVDSVVMRPGEAAALIEDARRFTASRSWYEHRGVPYRRGYLFEGPPGTGKSSLALALATELSLPIYVLNLGSIKSDDEFVDAMLSVPESALLLFEDVDAAGVGAPRPADSVPATEPKVATFTLSCLLNAIDGVYSKEGRVLVMTTNHPENIDAALLRPGRVDRRVMFDNLGEKEVRVMCRRFFDDRLEADRFASGVQAPISAAELQNRLTQETWSEPERMAAE